MSATSPAPLASSLSPITGPSTTGPSNLISGKFPRLHCTSRIVIPARLASTRLPQKLTLRETGKPLIQHTFEAVQFAKRPSGVTIAVDSPELHKIVSGFGGEVVDTDPELPSGTDRISVVAEAMPDVDIFVNVQGDEPEITGEAIDRVVELLEANPSASVATLAAPIRDRDRLDDPACVKVTCDHSGRALYFSRSPIPHARSWDEALLMSEPPTFLQHIGIYAYRRDFLLKLSDLPASPLESLEKLEQLRFLQAGHEIRVGVVEHAFKGIDTREDYRAFVCRQSQSFGK